MGQKKLLSGLVAILILTMMLAGCATQSTLKSLSVSPICTALVGPIKYNTYVKTSRRYAAQDLAVDLKVRNQVGMNLECSAYAR